jgi:two-component system, OmpR family, sensor histidine kinase BaeS
MLRTLGGRLVLSHILPLIIIVPLMGIALIYIVQTEVLLNNLATDLTSEARLIAEMVDDRDDVWRDDAQAQALVTTIEPLIEARIMLLDPLGHLLASSDPEDAVRLGQVQMPEGWDKVQEGQISVRSSYSRSMDHEIVDVLVPVHGDGGRWLGVVRLSHQLINFAERFVQIRYWIVGVLLAGLLLGAGTGWLLALNLEHPLQRATKAVVDMARGAPMPPITLGRLEEIDELLRAVNNLAERLESAEQARRQLLANLVHELGRPLGAMRPAIQALKGRAGCDEALRQELLEGMDDEINRLKRLLDDLAGLHDQALGTLELELRPLNLGQWLPSTLAPWREAAQAASLHWETSLPPDLPTIQADADRLGQALGNLLSNAIKYTPRRGRISVQAGSTEEAVWIRVSDTGPGLSEEEQTRILMPFYRSQTGRRFPQGMGLGLPIASALAAAHGGRLDIESTPGLGSDFTIWLPLHIEDEEPA